MWSFRWLLAGSASCARDTHISSIDINIIVSVSNRLCHACCRQPLDSAWCVDGSVCKMKNAQKRKSIVPNDPSDNFLFHHILQPPIYWIRRRYYKRTAICALKLYLSICTADGAVCATSLPIRFAFASAIWSISNVVRMHPSSIHHVLIGSLRCSLLNLWRACRTCVRARPLDASSMAIRPKYGNPNNGDDNKSDDNDEIVRCLTIDSVKQFSNKIIKTKLHGAEIQLRWLMFRAVVVMHYCRRVASRWPRLCTQNLMRSSWWYMHCK